MLGSRFELKKYCNPRYSAARLVQYALSQKTEEEIDRLLKHGIIENVHGSERFPVAPVLKRGETVIVEIIN